MKNGNHIALWANAKINLTLGILGRRADGYHEIETVMQSVTLADDVDICRAGGSEIAVRCSDPRLPQGEGNLAFRAARKFFAVAGLTNPGISIRIRKRIPAQAGLGGGSADAAAVLAGLNRLFGAAVPEETLLSAAASLGADVPFGLAGGTQTARGIGEKLAGAPPLPDCLIVIAKPSESVPTAEAYAAYDRLVNPRRPDRSSMLKALSSGDLAGIAACLGNSFEAVCGIASVPAIKKEMLRAGALGACMSGSGSAVLGIFDRCERAKACVESLKPHVQGAFLCRPARAGCPVRPDR